MSSLETPPLEDFSYLHPRVLWVMLFPLVLMHFLYCPFPGTVCDSLFACLAFQCPTEKKATFGIHLRVLGDWTGESMQRDGKRDGLSLPGVKLTQPWLKLGEVVRYHPHGLVRENVLKSMLNSLDMGIIGYIWGLMGL